MTDPRVSILMAVHNGAEYLDAAMRSVLTQDFTDFEFVVVDDASTDTTLQMVHAYGDARVLYHRNPTNIGQTASLNVALRLARGEYLARMDADDEYLPGKLRAQVAFLDREREVAVCGTWAECMDQAGRKTVDYRPPTKWDDIRQRLVWTSPICHVSVLMRREPVVAVGGYDESYRYSADFRLWSELVARGYVLANLPEILMRYRVFESSFSGASLLGAAGDESARIIAQNALTFAGVPLEVEDARAIHLRAHPHWGGERDRLRAYRAQRQLAIASRGALRLRDETALAAAFAWSLACGPSGGEAAEPKGLREQIGLAAGRALRHIEPQRLSDAKALIRKVLA